MSTRRLGYVLGVVTAAGIAACGGSTHAPAAVPAAGPVAGAQATIAPTAEHSVGAAGHRRVHAAVSRRQRTATRTHGRAAVVAARPVIAHGGTAKFSPAATGRAGALKVLAASVPSPSAAHRSPEPAVTAVTASVQVKTRVKTSAPHRSAAGSRGAAAFIASADTVCTRYRSTVRGIAAGATSLAAQELELTNLVNATSASLKQLDALTPPASVASLATRYESLVTASVRNFVLAQTRSSSLSEAAGQANETQDMVYAQRSGDEALDAQATAHHLGFHVCGSGGAEWL